MNFFAFAQTIFAYRLYVDSTIGSKATATNGGDVLTMKEADFLTCITKLPERL